MAKQRAELEDWETIREECKYPIDDDNDGCIYGIALLCHDDIDIEDFMWFKTTEERNAAIIEYDLNTINCAG